MRYNVTIMETLARTVLVEAGSETEAELAVRSMYRVGGFVLTADDYVALPYGKTVKEGAPTQEGTPDNLYANY